MILLAYEELEEIIEKITAKITYANRAGNLEELLSGRGLSDLLSQTSAYETMKDGKIVVVGASEVKENILNGIIKNLGLEKSRFEFLTLNFALVMKKQRCFNIRNLGIILSIE